MTAQAQRIRVGLFAAITLALLSVVLIVFGGLRFWEKSDTYCIVFDSSVMGLEPGAEVYLNGIKVGTVDDLQIPPEDIRKVAVLIKVKRGTPIHGDTHAMLQLAGITGLKVIDLRDGSLAAPVLPPGSRIAAGVGILDKLEAQAQSIVDQTTVLMKRAGDVMERANVLTDNLIAVTDPAQRAATNLAEMSGALRAMVDENRAALRETLGAIKQTATGASALIDGQVAPMLAGAGDVIGESRLLFSSSPSERQLP
jgi:ABC-type transporter Mla subunit MlaD